MLKPVQTLVMLVIEFVEMYISYRKHVGGNLTSIVEAEYGLNINAEIES